MLFQDLKSNAKKSAGNGISNLVLSGKKVDVYQNSFFEKEGVLYFIGKEGFDKSLYLAAPEGKAGIFENFEGAVSAETDFTVKKCLLNTQNRRAIQAVFEFLKSKKLGLVNSFGLGDRLGMANGGHIRALVNSGFQPILAQQSIRELTRTQRTADDVMDAAVWAVMQEGFDSGFGSDADHLKTTADIDMLYKAGFTMFTFDPGEHVNNLADQLSEEQLYSAVANLPWTELKDTFPSAERRYAKKDIVISPDFTLKVSAHEFLKAYAKYGKAILHIKKMYDHLNSIAVKDSFEVEVSVDETESVTSPFEHYFFANELKRLNVEFVSLAPRFVGSFEKGVDYKGDLELFKTEYIKHLSITKYFGTYKISLHSGSDKFSVYKVIGSMHSAFTHVKTAGTSYLEALKVVAIKKPDLFRAILDFGSSLYETEKLSYHVSADLKNLKKGADYSDAELVGLFDSLDARQVLHVTFGRTLTEKNEDGSLKFKSGILNCLKENEDTHYELLIKHFNKHLEPFK
jgi:hypothetical protein